MLGDFHVHSRFSDGKLSIAEIVDLYGSQGFGAISITDHLCEEATLIGKSARFLGRTLTQSTFPQYLKTLNEEAARAWDQYKMLLIPGVEFTKNALLEEDSAHVLALGIDEFIRADEDIPTLTRKIREQGALAVAAHPVNTRKQERQTHMLWSRRDEYADHFDAWEVASGAHIFDEVAVTGLPKIASSDLHGPLQLRSWKTELECERHPEAILAAIKKQELKFRFFEPQYMPSYCATQKAPLSRTFSDRVFDWSLTLF